MKGESINERAFQKNGDIYNNIINCRLYYRLNYGSCPWSIATNHGSCSWYLYHHPRHCVNGLGLLNPHNLYSIFWRNVWFTIYHIGRRSCFDAKHTAGYLYRCARYMDYTIQHQRHQYCHYCQKRIF